MNDGLNILQRKCLSWISGYKFPLKGTIDSESYFTFKQLWSYANWFDRWTMGFNGDELLIKLII